jgi:ACR3 family arsenite efflux pump ArsB
MTTNIVPSFWRQLGDVYDNWQTQILTNLLVFVIATSFALFLDLRLGVEPEAVMLYTLALMVVLMVGIPVLLVTLQRSIVNRTIPKPVSHLAADKHSGTPQMLSRHR